MFILLLSPSNDLFFKILFIISLAFTLVYFIVSMLLLKCTIFSSILSTFYTRFVSIFIRAILKSLSALGHLCLSLLPWPLFTLLTKGIIFIFFSFCEFKKLFLDILHESKAETWQIMFDFRERHTLFYVRPPDLQLNWIGSLLWFWFDSIHHWLQIFWGWN